MKITLNLTHDQTAWIKRNFCANDDELLRDSPLSKPEKDAFREKRLKDAARHFLLESMYQWDRENEPDFEEAHWGPEQSKKRRKKVSDSP
jgi:hypothetical protein